VSPYSGAKPALDVINKAAEARRVQEAEQQAKELSNADAMVSLSLTLTT
jgi:hypothetical protein|tara:strand:+ start:84 stop:230 length:147 start_codon:yes stop_codon:yes gene_type:complete